MHEGEAFGVEQAGAVCGRRLVGIEAVRDGLGLEAEPLAQVARDRLGHCHDSVGGLQHRPFEPGVRPCQERVRPRWVRWVERPAVAQVGDPGHAAAPQREAHQVGRLRRTGGDHAVGAQRRRGAERTWQEERQPGDQREVRHHQRLQRAGLAVGARPRSLHGLQALAAPVEPRGEQVAGANRGRVLDGAVTGGK